MDNQKRPIEREVPASRRKRYGGFKLILIVFLILVAAFFMVKGVNYSDYEKVATIKMDQASNISIDANANIHIVPTSGNQITISINGKATHTPSYEDSSNGNTIEIKFNKGLFFGIAFSDLDMTVEVPRNYTGDFKATTSSGEIAFDITGLKNVLLNASSGEIIIGDLKCNNLAVNSSSGSIYVSSANAKDVNIGCSSGSITIDSLEADDVKIDCSSGEVQVKDIKNTNAKIYSSSGRIDVAYIRFDNDIEIGGSSGSIHLTLPKTAEFKLDAETSSGGLHSDFDINATRNEKNKLTGSTSGSPSNEIKLGTSSGSINIEKNE